VASKRVTLRDYPRLTRFYGIPPKDLARMPKALVRIYAEELPILQAEEMLLAFLASEMPYLDTKEHHRIKARFMFLAGIEEEVERLDPNSDEGKAKAAALGIGVNTDRG